HSAVQGLAGYVFDTAVDAQMSDQALARRAGVVRTGLVTVRTTLLLLRERFRVETAHARETRELLAEDWQLIAFRGAPASPEWLSQADTEALIDAKPDANIGADIARGHLDRKSTRLNSSHVAISYAVFCLKKKNKVIN